MVQTNSHRFNTHVKRLSLSASVVIIFITRLLATRRIITQYFNHLMFNSFTTSPLWSVSHSLKKGRMLAKKGTFDA